jgi:radical SAM superfamily enzyme
MLRKAGGTTVTMGVESGSGRILKFLNTGVTTDMIKRSADLVQNSGISLKVSFMIGVPGESFDEMNRQWNWYRKSIISAPICISTFPIRKCTYEHMISYEFEKKNQDAFSIFDLHNLKKKSFNLFID